MTITVPGASLDIDAITARFVAHSPFLARLIELHGDVVGALGVGEIESALGVARQVDARTVAARLRRQRGRTVLALAFADVGGLWPLEPIVRTLSDFADYAVETAIETAIRAHVPGAEPQGFAAIALGKHGSRELNFSSDIDPIFIYDPQTLPHLSREEPAEAAVRIARHVVDLLQTRDADGFVFRVDLRLRPASEATPIALPVDAAIAHYESSALAWERAAFIRARAAAGDVALGRRFLDAIGPFVWRRSLDFGAIGELRALTRAIRDHHGNQLLAPGFDVKRGRGGIREVEFHAQIQQLIHGGRNPALRDGATLPALAAIARAGLIESGEAADLADAYRVLRTIEHRLQLVDDRQTHLLPKDTAALDNVARLHGLADGSALLALLRPHVDRVGSLYDALDDNPGQARRLSGASAMGSYGFRNFVDAEARIARWRAGSIRAIRSPAAVAAFEKLLPDMLADMGKAPDPDAALARLDLLLGHLSSGINLFRLLDAQPGLRVLLVDILSHAPILAEALAQRSMLLDRLVDRTAFGPVPDASALIAEMTAGGTGDAESVFDGVRHVVGEYRFALGVQIVEGAADPLDVAAGYGALADVALEVVASRVIADFELVHGRVPGGELIVVALGRYGGGLLTHASDLDLIYLFSGDFGAESDGERPLGATHYFNRLAQRVTGAMSVPTSVGPLYEVDTRLRPSGTQGPLVVSVDSFEQYQREAAWTWEHMALARARPVFGSEAGRQAVCDIVRQTLERPRTVTTVAADVLKMRAEITIHKPAKGFLDVKLGQGGLVDLEFIVHFQQLIHGVGLFPDLRQAIAVLAKEGFVEVELGAAHDLLTRLLVVLRLVSPDLAELAPATRVLLARACNAPDWMSLLAQLETARQCVSRHFAQIEKRAKEA